MTSEDINRRPQGIRFGTTDECLEKADEDYNDYRDHVSKGGPPYQTPWTLLCSRDTDYVVMRLDHFKKLLDAGFKEGRRQGSGSPVVDVVGVRGMPDPEPN